MAAVSIQFTPKIKRAVDGGDGCAVVLWPPPEFPVASPDGPGAKANRGQVKVGIAESPQLRCRNRSCHNSPLDVGSDKWVQAIEWIEVCVKSDVPEPESGNLEPNARPKNKEIRVRYR